MEQTAPFLRGKYRLQSCSRCDGRRNREAGHKVFEAVLERGYGGRCRGEEDLGHLPGDLWRKTL
jgi:hypothetical protein